MGEDYCELCDLPFSQCVHGMPKPPPEPVPTPRATRPTLVRNSAARTPAPRAARPAASTVRRTPPSLVTAQEVFRPHIVRILKQEGRLETEDVLLELEMALEDVLRDRDRQRAPTGETRWHATARSERKAMIDAGLMVEGKPGVWELTPTGHAVAY